MESTRTHLKATCLFGEKPNSNYLVFFKVPCLSGSHFSYSEQKTSAHSKLPKATKCKKMVKKTNKMRLEIFTSALLRSDSQMM